MSNQLNLNRLQIIITLIVTTLILSLLLWQHFNAGVPSHHVLQRKDLPEISNWLGAIVLPVLTWVLLGRIKKRFGKQGVGYRNQNQNENVKTIRRFIIGLLLGAALALSFTNNYTWFLDNVLYLLLILGLIVPIFYSEFILGFVLAMSYTFGAILPTVFVLIIAAVGLLLFKFLRPLLLKLFSYARG